MGVEIYCNKRRNKVYATYGNCCYEHVGGIKWREVDSAKTPLEELDVKIWGAIYDSFKSFISTAGVVD